MSSEALRDRALSAEELGERVEVMGTTGTKDGLFFGADGKLYISALEENAIKRFDPETRSVATVVQDESIRWPDSFTRDGEGRIYFTTAQIHLGPNVTEPYRTSESRKIRLGRHAYPCNYGEAYRFPPSSVSWAFGNTEDCWWV